MAQANPLIVIVGPTASGKTSLAIKLAKKYNGEVICADSRTIYRQMDIGTAKPTRAEMKGVKHHLLSVVDPDQAFNVADFKTSAMKCIHDISQNKKLPIMVGGSGLYINSILYDFNFGAKVSPDLRKRLDKLSVHELQSIIKDRKITMPENSSNKRYLIRAIELGGLINHNTHLRSNTLTLGLKVNRDALKARIEERVNKMFEDGVVEEAIELSKKYGWNSEPMKANIYRVLKGYISGDLDLSSTKDQIVKSDMRLAKKQVTWFKRNKNIIWGNEAELVGYADNFVKNIN